MKQGDGWSQSVFIQHPAAASLTLGWGGYVELLRVDCKYLPFFISISPSRLCIFSSTFSHWSRIFLYSTQFYIKTPPLKIHFRPLLMLE